MPLLLPRSLFAVVALALLFGCTTTRTTQSGAIGVDRGQYIAVSRDELERTASLAYEEQKNKALEQKALNTDRAMTARVRKIADRLIPFTAVFRPDAVNWRWEANVQTSKELNAYCMPGGKIMVYSGLITTLQLTDAEIAAVMGHEIAHALREHAAERISRAQAQQLAIGATAVGASILAGRDLTPYAGLADQAATVAFQLPNSREHEAEADRIGMELMARAGYNPQGAVSVWKKMLGAGGSEPPKFLSTHPPRSDRIADLEALLPVTLPLYEEALRAAQAAPKAKSKETAPSRRRR